MRAVKVAAPCGHVTQNGTDNVLLVTPAGEFVHTDCLSSPVRASGTSLRRFLSLRTSSFQHAPERFSQRAGQKGRNMNHRNWFFSWVTTLHNLGGLRRGAFVLAAAVCLLAAPAVAQLNYTVNNSGDPGTGTATNCPVNSSAAGPGICTLRDALAAANASASSAQGAAIVFDSSLTTSGAADIKICNSCGPYQVSNYIEIVGPSSGNAVEIDGAYANGLGLSMLFQESSGSFVLTGNLILMNGAGTGAYPGGAGGGGQAGGIEIDGGSFLAIGVTFQNNLGLSGGAIYNNSNASISGSPTVSVSNCQFNFNSTGITSNQGSLLVQSSTFFENAAAVNSGSPVTGEAAGGILANNTAVTVQNSSFLNNYNNNNGQSGGAIALTGTAGVASIGVTGSTFAYNSAVLEGGAAYIGPGLGAWFTDDTFYANSVQTHNNSVTNQGGGSGIFADSNSALSLLHVTMQDTGGDSTYWGVIADGNMSIVNSLTADVVLFSGTINYTSTYYAASPAISGLGNYGGSTKTMMPLTGMGTSPMICAAATTNLGNDATGSAIVLPLTDQRGYPRVGSWNSATCLDVGAVQTAYTLNFTVSPSNPQVGGTTITATTSPTVTYPAVQLLDHGTAIPVAGATISIGLGFGGALSGTTTEATAATGIATFNALTSPHVTTGVSPSYLIAYIVNGPNDNFTMADSGTFDITNLILPATTLAGGTVGASYSQTINPATGGVGTLAYHVTGGALPTGLTLNSATGAITGTPFSATAASFTITATDGDGDTATQNYTIAIAKGTPGVKVTLTAGSNPVFMGNSVTFTATVALSSPAGSVATPTGTVTFYVGGTTALCSTVTMTAGAATCTTTTLALGSDVITASYVGDSNYTAVAASASTSLTEVVMALILTPQQMGLTVIPGQAAVYTITVGTTPSGSPTTFPAPVTFTVTCGSCTGGTFPAGITSGLNFTSLSATGTLVMTIQTTQVGRLSPSIIRPGMASRYGPLALALLLLPFARRLRRTGRRLSQIGLALLLAVVSLTVAMGVSGCGSSVGFFGQAQQSYSVVVTATSGSYTDSTTVSVTVE